MRSYDVVILGAGAAGLMCAAQCGKRGRRVALLERAERIGKKILISGGGRCNFTNIHCQPENFISNNEHFAKSALSRYKPADFIELVEKHGIKYHEKTLGQLFCDGSSDEITFMLQAECAVGGVEIFLKSRITEVSRSADFIVRTENDEFRSSALVVATGALSIPKMGATGFGYDLARQFGLAIVEPWPALVPLVFAPKDRADYSELAGISAEVIACAENSAGSGPSFREDMLITHRGLSGPAILQASSYWSAGHPIRIDLAPGREVTAPIRDGKVRSMAAARSAFQGILANRFATRWLDLHEPPGWSNADLEELERLVHEWEVMPAGTESYEKAEVTAGGVDTNELSSKTMESRKVPGLFFIGEVVDVTGQLGGFNFQWAWASAVAAADALSAR